MFLQCKSRLTLNLSKTASYTDCQICSALDFSKSSMSGGALTVQGETVTTFSVTFGLEEERDQ